MLGDVLVPRHRAPAAVQRVRGPAEQDGEGGAHARVAAAGVGRQAEAAEHAR